MTYILFSKFHIFLISRAIIDMEKFSQLKNISRNQLKINSTTDKRNLDLGKCKIEILSFFELLMETDQKLKSKKN